MAAPRQEAVRAGSALLPRPLLLRGGRFIRSLVPTGRSIAVGWGIAAVALGCYFLARETSLFAVQRIEVLGVPPSAAAEVRQAVAGFEGTSLVGLDGGKLLDQLAAVPTVYGARYDRAFPHSLRISVRVERPVAVLRRGIRAWLVSARARVLAPIVRHSHEQLPRIWVPGTTSVAVGATLAASEGGTAASSLAPLARTAFPARIRSVALERGELRYALASGLELRLGHPDELRLKLAIARRLVSRLPDGSRYLDVSVPARPVAGAGSTLNSLVEG